MDRRTVQTLRSAAIAIAGALLIVASPIGIARLLPAHSLPPGGFIVIVTAATVLAAVWTIYFVIKIGRRADELHRTLERDAWYWGGISGLLLSLPLYAFIGMGGLHWIDPALPLGAVLFRAFVIGYGLPICLQGMGFVIAILWQRHKTL
jgi:hypothetical protein